MPSVLYSQVTSRGLSGPDIGGKEHFQVVNAKDNNLYLHGIEEMYSEFVGS